MPDVPRPVPPELWGRDHFAVLAYAGHVAHKSGTPDRQKMRAQPGNPMMGWAMAMLCNADPGRKFPGTRLQGGVELADHDDWDCVDDLIAAGLLENHRTGAQPLWSLTEEGLKLWSHLVRNHKTVGAMAAVTWQGLRAAAGLDVTTSPSTCLAEGSTP